jgi:hypothetical protein
MQKENDSKQVQVEMMEGFSFVEVVEVIEKLCNVFFE